MGKNSNSASTSERASPAPLPEKDVVKKRNGDPPVNVQKLETKLAEEEAEIGRLRVWSWVVGTMGGATILGLAVGYLMNMTIPATLIGLGVGLLASTLGVMMMKIRKVKKREVEYI